MNYSHNQHYQPVLFPELIPSHGDWTPVPQEEAHTYLPEERESPWLQYKSSEDDSPQKPFRMKLFEVVVH